MGMLFCFMLIVGFFVYLECSGNTSKEQVVNQTFKNEIKPFMVGVINEVKTIFINGQFTFRNHDDCFNTLIAEIKKNKDKRIIIDFSNCDFIDSAGLGMLVIAHDEAIDKHIELVLKGAKNKVKDILYAARFETIYIIE